VRIEDFDGDGKNDAIIEHMSQVFYAAGSGSGQFASPTELSVASGYGALSVVDVDGDGLSEIVFNQVDYSDLAAPQRFTILRMDEDRSFQVDRQFEVLLGSPYLAYSNQVFAHDLNGDGVKDLVVKGDRTWAIIVRDRGGNFAKPRLYAVDDELQSVIDINLDGSLDLIFQHSILLGL
jgi:hypothetical protein